MTLTQPGSCLTWNSATGMLFYSLGAGCRPVQLMVARCFRVSSTAGAPVGARRQLRRADQWCSDAVAIRSMLACASSSDIR